MALIILFLNFIICYLSVPIVNKLGNQLSILDNPNSRKKHSKPLVRLGGLAIYMGFLLPILIFCKSGIFNINNLETYNVFFICTFLFFILGILEDIFHLSLITKLTSQILIASYGFSKGLSFNILEIPFSEFFSETRVEHLLCYFFTVLWIVSIVNAFNWVDGLDGLASGLVLITSSGFLFLLITNGVQNPLLEIILIGIIGSNLGFIIHNFHPAKIFMGDGGSFFIGSVIAFLSINPEIFPLKETINYTNFFTKVLIIGLPLLDMSYVIIIRLLNGKSPFLADRSHFHHRLIDYCISHKKTVCYCYLIQITFFFIGGIISSKFN